MSAVINGVLYEDGEAWTAKERKLHINVLEILGALRTATWIREANILRRNVVVHWMLDNTTALAVVMNRGSRIIQLHEIAEQFVLLCENAGWTLRPSYVASALNAADGASRNAPKVNSTRLPSTVCGIGRQVPSRVVASRKCFISTRCVV